MREIGRTGVALAAGATAFALLIATHNTMILRDAGRPVEWGRMVLGELPVWYTWLALFPAIRALVLRFPPIGRRLLLHLPLHVVASLLCTLVMVVVVTAVRMWIGGLVPPGFSFFQAVRATYSSSYIVFLPIYGILVTGVLAWDFYRETQRRAIHESDLRAALASARLESLRDQIHPHFLFNTLHAISALMAEDVQGARRMMRRLSELLRLSLDEGPHEVTVDEELEILEMYVGIQRIRFGDRLEVRYEIDPAARPLLVPRLLLQPLVENAIKHGAGGEGRGLVVVRALRSDHRLTLSVSDDGPGFRDGPDPKRRGIGLSNTAARLEQLYGADVSMELDAASEGGARVVITVPARVRG